MRKASFMSFALQCAALSLGIASFSCSQYEYASPTPGILEVRLRVKNTRTDLLPFAETNFYAITLTELEARKSDGVHLRVLADLNAIRRLKDGDFFNCLASAARDSQIVLGKTYAPPTTFTSLDLQVKTSGAVLIRNGFISNFIFVSQAFPPPPALQRVPGQQEANMRINEGRLTLVTVTMDLDSTLVRRTEVFEYHPYFYISSIQNY